MPAYLNQACLYHLYDPADRHARGQLEDHFDRLPRYPALEPAVLLAQSIISPRQGEKLAAATGSADSEFESTGEDQIGERTASALLNARMPEGGVAIEGDVPFRVASKQYGDTFSSLLYRGPTPDSRSRR